MPTSPNILIEGRPGAGKTTAARRVVELLIAGGRVVAGFTTEELREGKIRVGFAVEAIGGERAVLAHVERTGPPRVGKYGVDVEAFEAVALPALERDGADVIVIDEIGKMELASERFRQAALDRLDGDVPVIATIHRFQNEFTDALKQRDDVELVALTRDNRDSLPEEIAARSLDGTLDRKLRSARG